MAKRSLSMEGASETLRAFRQLPKDASQELRARSQRLSELLAEKAQQAASVDRSPQAKLVVPTVKARRDRVPVIAAGGARRVGRGNTPVWQVLFGAEFGADKWPQFGKPHQGRRGSFLFPVAEQNRELVEREWSEAADEITRKWGDGQ